MNFGLKIIVNFEIIIYPEKNFLWIIIQYHSESSLFEKQIQEFQS